MELSWIMWGLIGVIGIVLGAWELPDDNADGGVITEGEGITGFVLPEEPVADVGTPDPAQAAAEPQAVEPTKGVPDSTWRDARQYRELAKDLGEVGYTPEQIREAIRQMKAAGGPQAMAQQAQQFQTTDADEGDEYTQNIIKQVVQMITPAFAQNQQALNALMQRFTEQDKRESEREVTETFRGLATKFPTLKGTILDAAIREYRENPDTTPEEIAAKYHAAVEGHYNERIKEARKTSAKPTPTITPAESQSAATPQLKGKTTREKLREIGDHLVKQMTS